VLKNLFFVTMTQYQKNMPVSGVAFPPEPVNNCLTQVLSFSNFKQMHISESEKERFVTYYFDGLRDEKMVGEDILIVPSPNVATYDRKPEMSLGSVVTEVKKVLAMDKYHFIVVNIANPDMVAHSGNLAASVKAVEFVDEGVGQFADAIRAVDGSLIITADHGNAEELISYPNATYFFTSEKGTVNTDHSNNPVPVIFIGRTFEAKQFHIKQGILGDIAPTILSMLGVAVPKDMTGRNLLV
jgi:2,3-bisphosphoglycerate-independent phosphoglycerate mutase